MSQTQIQQQPQHGSRTIHAYACQKAGVTVEPLEIQASPLGPQEVGVRITHTGIGALDLHMMRGDWNEHVGKYPMIPGHEIIGVIEETGQDVIDLKPGERVGIGFYSECCLNCDFCANGHEQLCLRGKPVGASGNWGGLADYIQVNQSMVFCIPENLDSAKTAPLLMSGATVYQALTEFMQPHMNVGVYGVGGVGHLAIKFARAMGLMVYAMDANPEKKEAALKLGAHRFYQTSSGSTHTQQHHTGSKDTHGCLDLVLVCSEHGDFNSLIPLLRHNGHLQFLCSSDRKFEVSIYPDLVKKNINISGTLLASRTMTRRMLKFASHNNIGADVELFSCHSVDDVNKAIHHVLQDPLFFRAVITTE